MSGLALGIDIGTSGIRTAVLEADGSVISDARADHISQDPDSIDAMAWWDAVRLCIAHQSDALRAIGRNLSEIGHIGVDGTSGSMVLVDEHLKPVTPALMYNSSGFAEEAQIIDRFAPERHITKGSNSALARALRLMSLDTEGRAAHLLHQADFVIARLLGRGEISDYNNSLKLGFDPETRSWPSWFVDLGVPMSLLPEPRAAGAAIDQVSLGVAGDLGLSPKTVVHAGTTDSIAAFLAAAPLDTGAAVTSLGTTLAVKILGPKRIDDAECGLYSHKLGDHWLVGGASNTGGGVLAAEFAPDELRRLSQLIDPSAASPLDYYPLRQVGERFPINDPTLAPRMMPRPDDDAEYLHGLLEGIARIEARCYNLIAERGGARPARLFTAGGGAANDVWTAIRARVIGIVPETAEHSEASIGVARLVQQHA